MRPGGDVGNERQDPSLPHSTRQGPDEIAQLSPATAVRARPRHPGPGPPGTRGEMGDDNRGPRWEVPDSATPEPAWRQISKCRDSSVLSDRATLHSATEGPQRGRTHTPMFRFRTVPRNAKRKWRRWEKENDRHPLGTPAASPVGTVPAQRSRRMLRMTGRSKWKTLLARYR